MYTKVCPNVVYILYTYCIYFVYISCINLVQFLYTKCIHSFHVELIENISKEQKSIFRLGGFNVNPLNYNDHNQNK